MAKVLEEATDSLEDFKWDTDETSFFGIKEEGIEAAFQDNSKVRADDDVTEAPVVEDEDEENTVERIDDNKDTKGKTKKPAKETIPEPFTEDKVEEVTEEEAEETKDTFYSTLASEMKDKGVFQNIDIPEEDIDEEKFFELQDAEIEARVNETFEGFMEEMDDDAKAFIIFKKNGGRTKDFFDIYSNQVSLGEVDIEDEDNQDKIISHYLRVVDRMDSDEITDRLEWLKDNGKKKSYAEKYKLKLDKIDETNKANAVKVAEESKEKLEKNNEKFRAELSTVLEKTEEIKDFKFTKEDKKDLVNYITKPSVKVGKNNFITPFMADLGQMFKGEGDKKGDLLLLAKLIKSNFDVKDIVSKTKTKVIQEAKSKLQSAKQGVKPSSSGLHTNKPLADFF